MKRKRTITNRGTGWRDLDEAFASTRKLLNQIKRDYPKLYKEALRRHKKRILP